IPRRTNRVRQAYQLVCYYFGLEAFERAAFEIAETNFRKAIDNSFDDDVALSARFWLGETKFRDGAFGEAISQYNSYLGNRNASKNEFYARAFYGLGWSNFKLKKYDAALKGFEDFIAKGGRNNDKNLVVDAYLRAGDAEFLRRRYSAANRYYQRVIDFRYTYRDYALYQIGESEYRQGKYAASTQSFAKIIENFKRSELRDNALDRISEIYLTWLNNEAQASKYAKLLVQDYPRSPLAAGAYNRLAIAAFNAGDANGAINYFKKVLQDYASDKDNAQVALENLSALLDPADFDKVFRDYRNANPELDNNVASIAFNTGKDRFFSGNYNSAIEQFSTYIRDFKGGNDYLESLLFRARSYRELGQYSNALKDYQGIYSTPSTNTFTSVALLEAGDIRYEQREFLSSLKLFEQLYDVSGKTQNRVQALFGQAKNHKAMEAYQQAIDKLNQIVSNNEVAVYSRTQARVEIGNCQYAAGALNQAMATFGEVENEFKNEFGAESQSMIVRIFYDLGMNLKAQGDNTGANAQFEQAKTAGLYQRNTYPTFNLWNARTFLYVAEANYELGETFQAIGVLESLINEAPYEDIKQQAQKRLDEIRAEENQGNG
ncbi:MAG: tetratricopeptide repeat protein, partial [Bacteroidota bacterium]